MTAATAVNGAAVARGVVWRVVEVIGSEAVAFGSFVVLARLLLPEDFGVVSQATLFVMTAQLVLNQGLPEALVQRAAIDASQFDSCFWANIALGLLTMALLVALAPVAAAVLSEPDLVWVMTWLAPTLAMFAASRIILAKLRREFRFQGILVLNLSATCGGALAATVMAVAGFGVWSLIAQQWVFGLTGLLMGWLYSRWWPAMRLNLRHLQELWAFSGFTMVDAFLAFCSRRLDLLILAFFWSAKDVGFYFLANRLLFSAGMLTYYSVSQLGLPFLARLAPDPPAHREAIYRTLRLVSLICLPTLVGLGLVAPLLLPLLFGASWTPSIAPFEMLAVLSIFYALVLTSGQVLISAGHARDAMVLSGATVALFLVAVSLAAPFGITAAAAAGGVANMIAVPLYAKLLRRRFGIEPARMVREQLPPWTATAAMVVVVRGGQVWLGDGVDPWANFAISVCAGAITFVTAVTLLARAEIADILASILALRGDARQVPGGHLNEGLSAGGACRHADGSRSGP